MAWTNPNPSVKQARNQPLSYPSSSRHQEDYRSTKAWHQAEAEAAAVAAGKHRTPSSSRPGG